MDLNTIINTPPWEWEDGTGEYLLTIIRDKQAEGAARRRAIELSGNLILINDEIAMTLINILLDTDEPANIRAMSAIGLGPVLEEMDMYDSDLLDLPYEEEVPISTMIYHEIMGTMKTVYDDATAPKQVRRRILEASILSRQEWHQNAIETAYASDDLDWVITAVFCMQSISGFDEQILEALEHENPIVHRNAVLGAGLWELKAAQKHVVRILENEKEDLDLLLTAIEAIVELAPAEAGIYLLDLADWKDEQIAEAANDAMMEAAMLSEMEEMDL